MVILNLDSNEALVNTAAVHLSLFLLFPQFHEGVWAQFGVCAFWINVLSPWKS